MWNINNYYLKIILKFFVIFSIVVVFYYTFVSNTNPKETDGIINTRLAHLKSVSHNNIERYYYEDNYVWLIFTKVKRMSPLRYKFFDLLVNLMNVSSVPLEFNIIVDNSSQEIALYEISNVVSRTNKTVKYKFHNVERAAQSIQDIVSVMTPYFSSKPGTYYSDALFYLSLGLHRIAPETQKRAVMLDCDLFFKKDIVFLLREFEGFTTELFGLAPELTTVYRHILHMYRAKHNTTFGDYYHPQYSRNVPFHPHGYQGYNSGVILFNLSAIRESKLYPNLLKNDTVNKLVRKYTFRGHLGDQDFYTLIGYEYPSLIRTLSCGFNRQLCTWWRDHGYKDVFNYYFNCTHSVVVLHGNCNSKIPK